MSNKEVDSCEWNPKTNGPAFTHTDWHADAEVIVGSNGQWRLCRTCSELAEFNRYRIRKTIIRPSRAPTSADP